MNIFNCSNMSFAKHIKIINLQKYSTKTLDLSNLERSIKFRTCTSLFSSLHRTNPRLYTSNGPAEGIDIKLEYIDTRSSSDNKNQSNNSYNKVILAIHGGGGSYHHFEQIIRHYHNYPNVRVIVPNLPNFSLSRQYNGIFWNSTLEKVEILQDFLTQLGVKQIDCAVGHSLGMHSILGMCEKDSKIDIKSIALFAPQPFYDLLPLNGKAVGRLLFLFKSEWWYNLLEKSRIHKHPSLPVQYKDINDLFGAYCAFLDTQSFIDLPSRISNIINKSIPVAIMYGTNEKFISSNSQKRLFTEFGIQHNESDLIYLDANSEIERLIKFNQNNRQFNKGYVIRGGGHFMHANFHNFTQAIVDNLILDL